MEARQCRIGAEQVNARLNYHGLTLDRLTLNTRLSGRHPEQNARGEKDRREDNERWAAAYGRLPGVQPLPAPSRSSSVQMQRKLLNRPWVKRKSTDLLIWGTCICHRGTNGAAALLSTVEKVSAGRLGSRYRHNCHF